MRAKDGANATLIPALASAMGATSRLEPQPRFSPATRMSYFPASNLTAYLDSCRSSKAWAPSESRSGVVQWRAGMISSVLMSLPQTKTRPLILFMRDFLQWVRWSLSYAIIKLLHHG